MEFFSFVFKIEILDHTLRFLPNLTVNNLPELDAIKIFIPFITRQTLRSVQKPYSAHGKYAWTNVNCKMN